MDPGYIDHFGQAGSATGPESLLAGFAGLFPGSGHATLGLGVGERKTVSVPAEKGFGPRDEAKVERYARQRTLPKTAKLPVSAYLKTFDASPQTGQEVRLSPYFPSRITRVQDGIVEMENIVDDGALSDAAFGTAAMAVKADRIVITLDPVIGAPFETKGKKGVIAGKNDRHFYVDFNHPLSGKPLTFDIEVLKLEKYSQFENIKIPWIEDFDAATEFAQKQRKHLVAVLYADWCKWSQRLLNITFADPRIKQYRDRLVWLKIDTDKEPAFREYFEQDDYPLIVLMDPAGVIVQKMGGFQDGGSLAVVLRDILGARVIAQRK
jgi:FKBP-type peptidyl-prolyl cis-trans isomerase 2